MKKQNTLNQRVQSINGKYMNLKEKFKEICKKVEDFFIMEYPYQELVIVKEDNECKDKLKKVTSENFDLVRRLNNVLEDKSNLEDKVMSLKGWLFFTNIFWLILVFIFMMCKVFPYA